MKPTLIVIAVIAGVTLILLLARWSGQREEKAALAHATTRGWAYLGRSNPELLSHLKTAFPGEDWYVHRISAPQNSGNRTYLFAYNMSIRQSRDRGTTGHACLAMHAGRAVEAEVIVTRRVPGVEKLVSDRVQWGGDAFRKECTVISRRPDVAARVINHQVETILLEHFQGREYVLDARFVGNLVVVMSHWADSPDEWDYIVNLARRLAGAVQ